MSGYNYTGQPYQPPNTVYPDPNHPYHQRILGYDVYQQYYDPAYTAPRGCCGMPFAFWWFIFGIFFPPMWILAACCLFSRNPYERVWARASLLALLLFLAVLVILGTIGGTGWWRRRGE